MTHHHCAARSMLPLAKQTLEPVNLSSFHPNHGYELQKLRSQNPEAHWCETAQKWLANPTQGSKPNDLTPLMGSKHLKSWSYMGEPPVGWKRFWKPGILGFIRQSSPVLVWIRVVSRKDIERPKEHMFSIWFPCGKLSCMQICTLDTIT